MKSGKVPNEVLNKIVLSKINAFRKDVLLHPGIGEDCAAIDFDKYVCVLSTDPITGAAKDIGKLAVHISCNDIASSGVEPLGLMVTILCPEGTTEAELGEIMDQLCHTASELNVEIIGGHTEVTSAVNKIVLSTTCIGKALKGSLISSRGAKAGDRVVITKTAGLEGAAILANDFEEKLLAKLSKSELETAKGYISSISVVKEGILAGKFGATSMHDITEGGILGAAWEVAEASGTGITLYKDDIPVETVTQHICDELGIDVLKLISSGCMLITCSDGEGLLRLLQENNIRATVVGEITSNPEERIIISKKEESKSGIEAPGPDELYNAIEKCINM